MAATAFLLASPLSFLLAFLWFRVFLLRFNPSWVVAVRVVFLGFVLSLVVVGCRLQISSLQVFLVDFTISLLISLQVRKTLHPPLETVSH